MGAVLYQKEHGIDRPVAFMSRKLDVHQRNYSSQHRELLGIIVALKHFMYKTDHQSLTRLLKQRLFNQRLYRWYDVLAEFDPIIEFLPGVDNVVADGLSRIPLTTSFSDLDEKCLIESQLLSDIRKLSRTSSNIQQIRKNLVARPDVASKYFVRDEILYFQSDADV